MATSLPLQQSIPGLEFTEIAEQGVSSSDPTVPVWTGEFWPAKQRAGSNLHEVSYRACFKPQLPAFFIERFTSPGDTVYDPFMGRGTTLIEAVLKGRRAIGLDINPISRILVEPRLHPPTLAEIEQRLEQYDLSAGQALPEDLLTFFHPRTLIEMTALREKFLGPKADAVDRWIQMVATNRLTGHSQGFFSVYTLPPNQAVTVARQRKINEKRGQQPEYREVKERILRKSKNLLKTLTKSELENLNKVGPKSRILLGSADDVTDIPSRSVDLIVTSPPFLDIVDYASDNWMRCWFNNIDEKGIKIWKLAKIDNWEFHMTAALKEMRRVLKPGKHIAFEVGEVRSGSINLERHVIRAAKAAGLKPAMVLIHDQEFTKTSHCWGIDNRSKGTNTQRIVLLEK
jgi:hypothetical protein